MKTNDTHQLLTVAQISKGLKRFVKEHADTDVVCCLPDGTQCYVVVTRLDDDGDVSICIEEGYEDSGCYSVEMLSDELQDYASKARIYMEGCGLLMNFEDTESPWDYNDDDDVVFCSTEKIGTSKENPHPRQQKGNPWLTKAEQHMNEEEKKKRRIVSKCETIVLALLTAGFIFGCCYNAYAIFATTMWMWANIMWGIVCFFLAAIGCLTLYFSKDE